MTLYLPSSYYMLIVFDLVALCSAFRIRNSLSKVTCFISQFACHKKRDYFTTILVENSSFWLERKGILSMLLKDSDEKYELILHDEKDEFASIILFIHVHLSSNHVYPIREIIMTFICRKERINEVYDFESVTSRDIKRSVHHA